jgi:hypothetical protein
MPRPRQSASRSKRQQHSVLRHYRPTGSGAIILEQAFFAQRKPALTKPKGIWASRAKRRVLATQ